MPDAVGHGSFIGGDAVERERAGAAMTDEIELKLELSPKEAHLLEASGLLAGDPKKQRQRSIYFDTADRRLAKAGLTLRIRRSGRKRIQTVKANGGASAGLFTRPEWERSVADDVPVIDDSTPIRALVGELAARLVLNRGAAIAGDCRSPICELELELKQGDAAALFALARKLDAEVPVRLGILTKSERGNALLRPRRMAFKAERIVLPKDATAADAFQRIVHNCLRQYRRNEDALLAGRSAEALHQARVALRRLRSAFFVFRTLVDHAGRRLDDELRWLAAELGEARNIDVLSDRASHAAFGDRLETARRAAYADVNEALASSRTRALMLDLAQWITCGAWLGVADARHLRDQPAGEFADAVLDRLRRKVKRHGRDLADADDDTRHKIRKDAKKLRYAADFFVSLFDGKRAQRRYKRFVAALEALQDQLGALNDLAMAPHLLRKLGLGDAPGAASLLDLTDKQAMLEALGEDYRVLIDAKRFWR
jgi:inorganic triphosphatase YgiF